MSNAWSLDPYKLAAQERTLEGNVAAADMARASKLLATDQGELAYKVAFTSDIDKICVISGKIWGNVTLSCQRCLQPYKYAVQCEFEDSPVANDAEAKELTTMYEPVITQEGKIDLLELFEDEVILALPQVPMHDEADCSVKIVVDRSQELNHPFQILQQLKKNGQQAEDK